MWCQNILYQPLSEIKHTAKQLKNPSNSTSHTGLEKASLHCRVAMGYMFLSETGHLYLRQDVQKTPQNYPIQGHTNRKDNINFMTPNKRGNLVCVMTQNRLFYVFKVPQDIPQNHELTLVPIRFKEKHTHDHIISLSLGDDYLIALTHRGHVYHCKLDIHKPLNNSKKGYYLPKTNLSDPLYDNPVVTIDTSQNQPNLYTQNGHVITL
jgi:alpha-tubulin suppressor-like RCC1 family protein